MKEKAYIAFDQYGQLHHIGRTRFPRKKLMESLGRKRASKMYIDRGDTAYHCGWIIAGLWLSVFEVIPMEIES